MNQLTFKVGTQLKIHGKTWTITNITDNEDYFLKNENDGSWQQKRLAEMKRLFSSKKLSLAATEQDAEQYDESTGARSRTPTKSLTNLNEAQQEKTLFKFDLVKKVREITGKVKVAVLDLTTEVRALLEVLFPGKGIPSNSTIYRWDRKLRCSGDSLEVLIERTSLRGKTGSRIDPHTEQIIATAIENQFKTRRRKTKEFIYHVVRAEID